MMFEDIYYDHHDYNYWWGSIWQLLVMIVFLINIWRTNDCSGLSLKSQILYALVFTTRHEELTSSVNTPLTIAIKIAFLCVTYGTVLSIYKRFSKTYEEHNDTFRIEVSIFTCLVSSVFLNDSFDITLWPIAMAFSAYLEAIAMLPQFQFVYKSERISKRVFLYLVGMAIYALLQIVHLLLFKRNWNYTLRIVAATVQFLLYCDFFHRVYPLICAQVDENEPTTTNCCFFKNIYSFLCSEQVKDSETNAEDEKYDKGHHASNVSSVVLTRSDIIGVHKSKA